MAKKAGSKVVLLLCDLRGGLQDGVGAEQPLHQHSQSSSRGVDSREGLDLHFRWRSRQNPLLSNRKAYCAATQRTSTFLAGIFYFRGRRGHRDSVKQCEVGRRTQAALELENSHVKKMGVCKRSSCLIDHQRQLEMILRRKRRTRSGGE